MLNQTMVDLSKHKQGKKTGASDRAPMEHFVENVRGSTTGMDSVQNETGGKICDSSFVEISREMVGGGARQWWWQLWWQWWWQ